VTPGTADPESTEALVERANEARERLLVSVQALDRKRHQLARPVRAVGRTLEVVGGRQLQLALVVGGALLGSGLLAAVALRVRRSRARSFSSLLQPRRSFLGEVLWHAGVGLASFTVVQAGKLTIVALLQAARAPRRPTLPAPHETNHRLTP
jgi:hypothetical protein